MYTIMSKEMKFKIGDKVKPTNPVFGKNFIGEIQDCWINYPENIVIENDDFVYVVTHYNYRGKMRMSYHIKESELVNLNAL